MMMMMMVIMMKKVEKNIKEKILLKKQKQFNRMSFYFKHKNKNKYKSKSKTNARRHCTANRFGLCVCIWEVSVKNSRGE